MADYGCELLSSYEKDGEIKQRTVRGTTSLICSINPETGKASKMYSWYCILAGEKVEQGVNVDLGNIIGAECRIMVGEAKAGKKEGSSFQNVVDVNLPAATNKLLNKEKYKNEVKSHIFKKSFLIIIKLSNLLLLIIFIKLFLIY